MLIELLDSRFWMPSENVFTLMEAALASAEAAQSATAIARVKAVTPFLHLWRCELDEALAGFLENMPFIEQVGDIDALTIAKTYLTMTWRNLGRTDQTEAAARELLTLAESIQNWMYIGHAMGHLAWVALRADDFSGAAKLAADAFQAWERTSAHPMLYVAAVPAMGVAYHLGDLPEVVRYIQMMLKPSQRRFPDYLEQLLTQTVAAFERGEFEAVEAGLKDIMPVLSALPFCYV
jgi:hypothetical protein